MDFYTDVRSRGNFILIRGVEDGERIMRKVSYSPSLYVPSKKPSEYRTLDGRNLLRMKFKDIRSAKQWVDKYDDVDGFEYFGNTQWAYAYISDNFNDSMKFDLSLLRRADIDIETDSENGFPEPEKAEEKVIAITCIINGKDSYSWGLKEYVPSDGENYFYCYSEMDLLTRFVKFWSSDYPDLVTSWNGTGFDIPYLVNRIARICGTDWVDRLSPWGTVYERTLHEEWGDRKTYVIMGIPNMDYLEVYKKFSNKKLENYRLETVCQEELGEGKVEYEEEYGTLANLYEKNPQLFMKYNIMDVRRVDQLDAKMKLMDMVLSLAYDMKCNYDDVFQQTRMWDSAINCHLNGKGIIVPKKVIKNRESFEGAFVIPPKTGMHEWVASFDLNSL